MGESLILKAGVVTWRLGERGTAKRFFDTVTEAPQFDDAPSQFPHLLRDLYAGEIAAEDVGAARAELAAIVASGVIDGLHTDFGDPVSLVFDEALTSADERGRPLRLQGQLSRAAPFAEAAG